MNNTTHNTNYIEYLKQETKELGSSLEEINEEIFYFILSRIEDKKQDIKEKITFTMLYERGEDLFLSHVPISKKHKKEVFQIGLVLGAKYALDHIKQEYNKTLKELEKIGIKKKI